MSVGGASALEKSIAIIPKVGGTLSMVASTFIVRDVALRWRSSRRSVPLTSAVVGCISVADWLYAFFGAFLSTWMAPSDSGHYLASGNARTCAAQGFIVTLTVGASMSYYAALMLLYWLIVRFRWTDGDMGGLGLQLSFTLPPFIIALCVAIPPLFLGGGMYNDSGIFACFLAPYPLDCEDNPEVDCVRGEGAWEYWEGFWLYNLVCNVIIVASVCLLICTVLKQERTTDKYLVKGQKKMRESTMATFWQGMRYMGAFMLSYLSLYIFSFYRLRRLVPPAPFVYIHLVLIPLLGFFNSFVYFHPSYKKYRERNPGEGWIRGLAHVLHIDLDCCKNAVSRRRIESADGQSLDGDITNPLFGHTEGDMSDNSCI
ncbi:hypothetical protein ACHAWF_002008 [Thalassiosira exigua]